MTTRRLGSALAVWDKNNSYCRWTRIFWSSVRNSRVMPRTNFDNFRSLFPNFPWTSRLSETIRTQPWRTDLAIRTSGQTRLGWCEGLKKSSYTRPAGCEGLKKFTETRPAGSKPRTSLPSNALRRERAAVDDQTWPFTVISETAIRLGIRPLPAWLSYGRLVSFWWWHLACRYGVVPKGLLTFLGSLYKVGAKTTFGTLAYRFERQTARKKDFSLPKILCPQLRM